LTGHSAGGHLVTRMICEDSPLVSAVANRIDRVISISGLHDLRPLLKTKMNDDFRMTAAQAEAESVALKQPQGDAELMCWVGANERPEFIRQSALLANIWTGFGLKTSFHQAQGQHHFNVIDGLCESQSPLARALLD
jgi:arylformamidase